MNRLTANTLRIVGMVVTVILVIGGCYVLLIIALAAFIRGALTPSGRILHPQMAEAFFGAILATITLVTAGIVMIVKLAKGIVRSPAQNSFKRPRRLRVITMTVERASADGAAWR